MSDLTSWLHEFADACEIVAAGRWPGPRTAARLREVADALAAAQQGQAVAWFPTNGKGEIIRNYGDGSPVYASRTKEEAEQAKRCHLGATGPVIPLYTAQQSGAVAPTTAECPHDWGQDEAHEDWVRCYKCGISRRKPLAQQPAAVDEAMVFRLAVWMAKQDGHDDPHHLILEGSPPEPWGEIWMRYEDDARSALTAALAAQPGGAE